MPITCPIREPAAPKATEPVRKRDSAPITRPVFPLDLDRELKIRDAMNEVRATYDRYQLALMKLRAIGGPAPDPTVDPQQLRFAFADQYVTEHYSIYQPNPALYGPWSSRLSAYGQQTAPPIKQEIVPTPPECRACLAQLISSGPARATTTKNADKRMEEIFNEIYKGTDDAN